MRFLSAAAVLALALANPALAEESVFRAQLKAPILFTNSGSTTPDLGTSNPEPTALHLGLSSAFGDWATVGDAVDTGLTASGGTPPYSYEFKYGIRPNDVHIQDGRLVGNFFEDGPTSFTVVASDSSSPVKTDEVYVSLDVETQPQIDPQAALIQGTVGTQVAVASQASGGKPSYLWSLINGDDIADIGPDGTIVIERATAGETATIRAGLTDARNRPASGTPFKVNFSDPLTFSYPSSATVRVGTALNISPSVTGGRGTKQFTLLSGDFPGSMTFSNLAGTLIGTPTSACLACSAHIQVMDADGRKAFADIVTNVVAAPTVSGLVSSYAWRKDVAIAPITLSASGAQGAVEWSQIAGQLPGGVLLNQSTGVISGVPNGSGTGTMTFNAHDSLGNVPTTQSTWVVTGPTFVLNSSYSAEALTAFTVTPTVNNTVNGGPQTRTFSLQSPPSGMTINATTGKIDWTPSTTGPFTAQVNVVDTDGSTGSAILNVTVTPSTAGNGGQLAPTLSSPTPPANSVIREYTYAQKVFITAWWIQANGGTSGACGVQGTLQVYNETTTTWNNVGSINSSGTCPRSIQPNGTVSGGQAVGKKFRVTMTWSGRTWSSYDMSIGTAQGMQ